MNKDKENLAFLIAGMKKEYKKGRNVMAWARSHSLVEDLTQITLIAYDLQAGTYVKFAKKNSLFQKAWGNQLAELLNPFISKGDKILEVGVGEGTTLTEVLNAIPVREIEAYGFDLSWSRISIAQKWVQRKSQKTHLFVGDLFSIPLADQSMDIVYTSHSLEPNGGKEKIAIKELMRIAKKAVVLVEPIYELATKKAKNRMLKLNYIKNLYSAAEALGGKIKDYKLLKINDHPLNPSGVISIIKPKEKNRKISNIWECPITGTPLVESKSFYFSPKAGIAYPVLVGVPLLRPQHAIIASRINSKIQATNKSVKNFTVNKA